MDRRSFLKAAGAVAAASPLPREIANAQQARSSMSPEGPSAQCAADDGGLLPPHIGLAGTWSFRLDPSAQGINERWFEHSLGSETIFLPGSTDQAGYGQKTSGPADAHLSRPYVYTGPAWYQRVFTIPDVWEGQRLTLFLERCHWQTSVWIDGVSYGLQNSLSVPHLYDLGTGLASGKHTLTICVDNTIRINVGASAHSISENTQTDWNGIIGKIELRSTPAVWIDNVRVFSDLRARTARFEVRLKSALNSPASGKIQVELRAGGASARVPVPPFSAQIVLTVLLELPGSLEHWDDIDPNMYVAHLCASTSAANRVFEHRVAVPFGIREIATRDRQFILNGRPVFLRGTVENAVFPLTAFPSMDLDDWRRIFRIVRSYGMNHLRFHSWCPPEVAFTAADEAGVLLHVELPVFSHHVGTTPGLEDFMRQEGHRIIDIYGNHPSFTFLCMGNELTGDWPFLDRLVGELKQADNRRLYTYSTNNGRPAPGSTSDYWVTEETAQGRLRIDKTRFGPKPGGTEYDFSKAIAAFNLPVVAHELGQWAVYPSYDEIGKYIGVLKPRDLEVFRAQLAAQGMANQAEAFQAASGRFAAAVYKEDIESAIRTPRLGGFQLLELTDYPGQQVALVGMLDCFWDSKHLITPEEFRRFCSDTVPLCRFEKFVWTSDETFRAAAQVAHYGKRPLRQSPVSWSIHDDTGRVLRSGSLHSCTALPGSVASLGEIALPLSFVRKAMRLTVELRIHGVNVMNSWQIWVYPITSPIRQPNNVLLTTSLDDAMARLEAGGTVFLCAQPGQRAEHLLPLRFLPVFWSFGMFKKQPGVLGILCDPAHPALASFPTDMHSNWQWWELTEGTNAFILDSAPAGFRPLIQVIDDFHRNHRLGLVIEAQVGDGKLLATSLPLTEFEPTKPVSRQLFSSLLDYASGDDFHPQQRVSASIVQQLISPAG